MLGLVTWPPCLPIIRFGRGREREREREREGRGRREEGRGRCLEG
jgi:hypothetical protein